MSEQFLFRLHQKVDPTPFVCIGQPSGFLSGSTGTMHFGNMLTISYAVTAHLVAFHMKSNIVILFAGVFFFCIFGSVYFFPASDITYDPFILLAFIVHLAFESLIAI